MLYETQERSHRCPSAALQSWSFGSAMTTGPYFCRAARCWSYLVQLAISGRTTSRTGSGTRWTAKWSLAAATGCRSPSARSAPNARSRPSRVCCAATFRQSLTRVHVHFRCATYRAIVTTRRHATLSAARCRPPARQQLRPQPQQLPRTGRTTLQELLNRLPADRVLPGFTAARFTPATWQRTRAMLSTR